MAFAIRPLKYPAGTELAVLWQSSLSFPVKDFIRLPDSIAHYKALFDFGDGDQQTVVWNTGDPDGAATHTYSVVGTVTLRITIQLGSGDLYEKYAWPIQVGATASDFLPAPPTELSVLPAAQATINIPGGTRHLFMVMPRLLGHTPTPPTPPGPDDFLAGLELLLRQFQQAYANGFGRIPVPAERLRGGIYLHLNGDVLAFGTSSALMADVTGIEQAVNDALADPERQEALAAVKEAYDKLYTHTTSLGSLTRMNLTGGNILVPGTRTTRLWDTLEWHAFVKSAIDETQALGVTQLQNWRKFAGTYDRDVPQPDWTTAYFWLLSQAVFQAANAMGARWGVDDMPNVRAVLQVAPGSGACTLRIHDDDLKLWVQVTLAPSGKEGALTLSDMVDDGHAVSLPGAGHVTGRVVGVLNRTGTGVPHAYDVRHIETALQGALFAEVPSIHEASFAAGLNVYREVVGNDTSKTLGPDGTSYVKSVSDDLAVVTIGVPALAFPDGKDHWTALEPLALLAVVSKIGF